MSSAQAVSQKTRNDYKFRILMRLKKMKKKLWLEEEFMFNYKNESRYSHYILKSNEIKCFIQKIIQI